MTDGVGKRFLMLINTFYFYILSTYNSSFKT